MAHIRLRPAWWLPERAATPERGYLGRRLFLRQAGLAGAGAATALLGLGACRTRDESPVSGSAAASGSGGLYPGLAAGLLKPAGSRPTS